MVKIRHFLPESSNSASLKVQLIQSGVLDRTRAVDPAILKCGSLSFRRYTRSALLLLRDENLSNAVPNCLTDKRLKMFPIWKNPPPPPPSSNPMNPVDPKDHSEPIRKHFTIMPAFAARRMTGNTNFDSSFKEDDRRMMYDQFATTPHPSVWSQSNNQTQKHNGAGGGSFFPDNNNNFMETYQQKLSSRKDDTIDGRYTDEPEWMNCGPTSRLDVIELRGFESDGEDEVKKKKSSESVTPPPARSTPAKDKEQGSGSDGAGHCSNTSTDEKHNDDPKLDFNFDFLTDESMTSILGQEKSATEKSSKGHVWFADERQDTSMNDSNKLMEFFLKGKQIRALTNAGFTGNSNNTTEKIPTLNDIEARIIPETNQKPEAPKKTSGTTLNPAAAPFVKKDVRTTVINEQAEIFNKLYSQISANNQSNAMTANLNILKALHQHNQTIQQQMNQRALQQQAQFQQLRGVNSDLLKTPEAQVLLQGLASGQFTFQSLQQQMNQPNKRSADIIRSVLNYATTVAGQAYLNNIQLIHQLSNGNKNKGNSNNNILINHNNSGNGNHLHSLNNRKFEQLNQHHLQQVQLQMQKQANNGHMKGPIDLHQHTENIMLEAMKRKRQQEILKSQMKINENNQRNCASTNFDFRRFSSLHQQQQQQLNGIFNQKQQSLNLQQSNINSLMLAKSNSDIMQHQQQQQLQRQQQQQQYPYRGINFPINQQAAQIGTQQQQHRQPQQHNPFMGRPILKSSIGSMNNNCPMETN
ncbi:Eif4enif1.2 family protein [Megaselia abdita]